MSSSEVQGVSEGEAEPNMANDRPAWARRMSNERKARGWSYADAARALTAHATDEERKGLPDLDS
jgi:hypothetical protein